jgi:hypothetical protein
MELKSVVLSKYRYFALIFFVILLLSGCSAKQEKQIQAENGVIDLSGWNADKDGIIALNGEWAFYWEQWLLYKDIGQERPDFYAEVPNSWTAYTVMGEKLPGSGYATYHLHVKTSLPPGARLALDLPALPSAYRFM